MPRILTALAVPFLLLASCSPVTLSVTLFADNSRLEEAAVRRDPNPGNAKILIIDIRGLIADRDGGDLFASGPNPVDELVARLTRAESDPAIRAVILRINSPGGSVSGSNMMYREIRAFSERSGKPVVAHLGEIAASGGYYIALAADYIVAEPASITGSIGVIIPTVNISDGLARIGIRSRSVTSRPNKDIANPLEPMEEQHYAILQSIVDEFYANFRALVQARRSRSDAAPAYLSRAPHAPTLLDTGSFDDLTDGRIMTGTRAVAAGLADRAGGIDEAFADAKALADVQAATLIKLHRQDQSRPRTPYALAETAAHAPGASPFHNAPSTAPRNAGTEINLLQLRLGNSPLFPTSSGAYYLWLPE